LSHYQEYQPDTADDNPHHIFISITSEQPACEYTDCGGWDQDE